jgi:LysR family nitrogen assimilation transcriptional regulator
VKKTSQPPRGAISRDLIDSKRLLYFFHVARMRSFSDAEAILGVAQPALSRQIKQLESELGVQLLIRNGHGVSLTQYGTILQEQAVTILGDMSTAVELLQLARRNPAGQISIAAPAGIMANYMSDILRRFVAAFPEVRITAVQAVTGEVYDHLASGAVDVAIILEPRSAQKLTCQRLMVEPLFLVARRDHPVSGQQAVEREQLTALPMILPASKHGMRDNIDRYFKEGGIETHCNVFIDSVPLMKALVLDTGVCCFLPKLTCDHDLDPAEFVWRPLKPALTRSLYVASLQARSKSPYVKALIREVLTVFKEKGERLAETA